MTPQERARSLRLFLAHPLADEIRQQVRGEIQQLATAVGGFAEHLSSEDLCKRIEARVHNTPTKQ